MKQRFIITLALLLAVLAQPERAAQATSTAIVVDQKVCTGSAAAAGGTMTCDYAIATDRASRIVANVGLTNVSAAHLANAAFIACEYIVENKNGSVTAPAAITGSNNPSNSGTTTFVAAHAQASDAAFVNAGGGLMPTCAWTISGTNARVTVTNNSVTSVAADVTVLLQAFNFGSQ